MVDGQEDTAPNRKSQQIYTAKKIKHRPDNSILHKKFWSRNLLAFVGQEGQFLSLK
jgi:hypothetical protein